ncbi:MAG TPA: hypothetical protein VLS90_18355, partial [Thermodesulfobacteriota bacterium]|nr:hypothetical protein [Thermodesulfobacteriota bacterium]
MAQQDDNRKVVKQTDELIKAIKKESGLAMNAGVAVEVQKLEVDIDDKHLKSAFSLMASRNLMNDILRSLTKIEVKIPPKCKPACAELKKTIVGFIKNQDVTRARYTHILCLGYRAKTAKFVGPANAPKVAYSGKTDSLGKGLDDFNDLKARCDDMKQAIRSAYNLAKPYFQQSKVLKVFMGPEFFFRGINGAYDYDVLNGKASKAGGVKGLLELMAEEIDQFIYKDWLFVLGTAIAAANIGRDVCGAPGCSAELETVIDPLTKKPKTDPLTKRILRVCTKDKTHTGAKRVDDNKGMIDNIAFIRKEKFTHQVLKQLVSNVDYAKNAGGKFYVNLRGKELEVNRQADWAASNIPPKFQDERMGGSVFTIDGVTFGLEICLDHISTTTSNTDGRLDNAGNIQVQLIPSCGMTIGRLRTVSDGIVFNVDGGTPHVQVVAKGATVGVHMDIGGGSKEWGLDHSLANWGAADTFMASKGAKLVEEPQFLSK